MRAHASSAPSLTDAGTRSAASRTLRFPATAAPTTSTHCWSRRSSPPAIRTVADARRSSREAAPDACPGTRSRHSSHSPSWTRPQSTRTEALGIASRQRLVLKEIDALELLAIDAGRTGDALRASRLKSAAAAARDQIGYRFQWPTHAADLETIVVDDSPVDRARRRDRIRAPWARRTPPPSVRVGRTHARGAGRGSASRRRRHHAGRRDATPRQQVDGQDTSRSHLRQARHQQPSRTGDRSHPSFLGQQLPATRWRSPAVPSRRRSTRPGAVRWPLDDQRRPQTRRHLGADTVSARAQLDQRSRHHHRAAQRDAGAVAVAADGCRARPVGRGGARVLRRPGGREHRDARVVRGPPGLDRHRRPDAARSGAIGTGPGDPREQPRPRRLTADRHRRRHLRGRRRGRSRRRCRSDHAASSGDRAGDVRRVPASTSASSGVFDPLGGIGTTPHGTRRRGADRAVARAVRADRRRRAARCGGAPEQPVRAQQPGPDQRRRARHGVPGRGRSRRARLRGQRPAHPLPRRRAPGPVRTSTIIVRDADDHVVCRVEAVDAGADDRTIAVATVTLQRA